MKIFQLCIKRMFDIVMSGLLLIILSPFFLIIAILIKLDSKGAVFFNQERAGQYGNPFIIYKFRTMCQDAERIGDGYFTGISDPRITKVGKFLRNWSIDELPQLINILKGAMSIIGPRPTLTYQIKQYDEQQKKRLLMKPGVTGWAQVNGRNSLSWPERIKLDIWYVENFNLGLDFTIMIKTVKVILTQKGIYAEKDKFIVKDKRELEVIQESFMVKEIILIGAGGHALVVLDILKRMIENGACIKIVGFLDDDKEKQEVYGYPVLDNLDNAEKYNHKGAEFIICIGSNLIREKIYNQFKHFNYFTAIHPKTAISEHVSIGKGTVVMAGVVINSGTYIGDHTIINTSSVIEHDNIIEEFCHISPNVTLCGSVKIGSRSHIGAGGTIIPNISIGKDTIIGAGAVVIRDVPGNCTAVGVPSTPIKFNEIEGME